MSQEIREFKINTKWSDDLASVYSNHVVVTHSSSGEFHLWFFEIAPPLLVGDNDEVIKQLEEIKSVDANCVSRIVVSKETMGRLIPALATNYNSFVSQQVAMSRKTNEKEAEKDAI